MFGGGLRGQYEEAGVLRRADEGAGFILVMSFSLGRLGDL